MPKFSRVEFFCEIIPKPGKQNFVVFSFFRKHNQMWGAWLREARSQTWSAILSPKQFMPARPCNGAGDLHCRKHGERLPRIWLYLVARDWRSERELGNIEDPYAIAVVKDGHVVGHLPRRDSRTVTLPREVSFRFM